MGFTTIKQFSKRRWLKLFKYSIGSRLINSVPKGLKQTYDFALWLKRNNIEVESDNESLFFNFMINAKSFKFHISQESSDSAVFNQIIISEEYKPVIDLMHRLNIAPQTMIDAGSNVGFSTMYFKAHYPNLRIVVCEPSSSSFQRLKHNLITNDFKNIEFLQKGLWNKSTKLREDTSFRDGQAWSYTLVETDDPKKAIIDTTTIQEILSDQNIEILDFLKMDIEGGEKEVFNHNFDLSWIKKIKVVAIEIHDEFNCRSMIESRLIEDDFELFDAGELTIGYNKLLCDQ